MDFIETLPTSSDHNSILIIIDHLTKQGIFIPTTINCTSEDLAIIFIMHVFSKHGVPEHVTSDRGSEFVSRFFHSLGKALDMKLHFTSSYHLEGDGQTERTNQTLEQYLRNFLQLPIRQLVYSAPTCRVCIQQFLKCNYRDITVLCQQRLPPEPHNPS